MKVKGYAIVWNSIRRNGTVFTKDTVFTMPHDIVCVRDDHGLLVELEVDEITAQEILKGGSSLPGLSIRSEHE